MKWFVYYSCESHGIDGLEEFSTIAEAEAFINDQWINLDCTHFEVVQGTRHEVLDAQIVMRKKIKP